MTRAVLFDLGNTLEENDVPLPGAREMVEATAALRDRTGQPAVRLGLVSDFFEPGAPEEIPQIREQYFAILDRIGIRDLFEPVNDHVTLSTEVGSAKPAEVKFRAATDRAGATFA